MVTMDFRKRQTIAASPAEPGDLPHGLAMMEATPNIWSRPWKPWRGIPDDLSDAEAAPLLCAGITTFNALRNSGARPGEVAAILGIGGLGHLAVQFAAKMGFATVAIARGKDKEALAKKLGALHYIDR